MNELSVDSFNEMIKNDDCAFICGNGFSMNFDSCFGNIYDRLYEAYGILVHNGRYSTSINNNFSRRCKESYNAVKDYLRDAPKYKFYAIFNDGIKFAESIIKNEKLITELKDNKLIQNMVFNKSQLTIVNSIYECGINKGIEFVNIEYWPILIYMYYSIKEINSQNYTMPELNMFIKMIEIGDKSNIILTKDENPYIKSMLNGFNTFYRMLFSTAIFANGKAIELKELDKLENLNIDKISKFMNKFKVLYTLNYDSIIENIINKEVYHLHGSYVCNKKEHVYGQSLGIEYKNKHISFSDISIGDSFVNKTMFKTTIQLTSGKNGNKETFYESQILEREILKNKINVIVIFGLNIDNDEYTMRNIIIAFKNANIKTPNIIFCYFKDQEKLDFEVKYREVNKFGEELTQYGDAIKINYIKTQDVLEEYFY